MAMSAAENVSETTERVECRKCHRALRSESSRRAGIGPRCAAIEAATEGLNAKQVDKMTQLIEDRGIVATNRKGVYNVVSETGEVVYRTHISGNCDCSWGLRRDSAEIKTCYHSAAAKLLSAPRVRKPQPVLVPVAMPASDTIWAELDALGATAGALAAF